MRPWRFAASLLLVAAVLAVYHWALAVNAVTAALTLLLAILFIILLLSLVGSVPAWPYSRDWGYYPSGGLGVVLVVVAALLLLGRI